MDSQNAPRLTRELANRLITAGVHKAETLGAQVAICVSDADATPISHQRMVTAPDRTLTQARNTAATAVRLEAPSAKLSESCSLAAVLQRHVTTGDSSFFAGGRPLLVGGDAIGAIGVGGSDATARQIVARAGRNAFETHRPSVSSETGSESSSTAVGTPRRTALQQNIDFPGLDVNQR